MKKHATLKNLVLCADDFAQTTAISEGILQLVQMGRLSAVSCITNGPLWHNMGPRLLPFRDQIDIGLHVNLSDGTPLTVGKSLQRHEKYLPFPTLVGRAMTGRLKAEEVQQEIAEQLLAFYEVMGFWPDFIDGHRHIHLLPTIQQSLLAAYKQLLPMNSAYIRLPSNGFWPALQQFYNFPKASLIHLLGANRLKKAMQRQNIPFNPSFAGIYRFEQHGRFAEFFQKFLQHSQSNGIVMCHPGVAVPNANHVLDQARAAELRYLMSPEIAQQLQSLGWQLGRYQRLESNAEK